MRMKNLYLILTVFLLCLFSCENVEETVEQGVVGHEVSISVEFSDKMAATRAISLPSTHKLRCIIEVWTKDAIPTLSYRQEVCIAPGGTTIPSFEFDLPGGDYQCLMWADAVKVEVEAEEESKDGIMYNHFADEFYNTSDLHTVTIMDQTGTSLFDTDLCDAFFASIDLEKGIQKVQKTLKLKRPFAKLIVKEQESEKVATLKNMKVEYIVPKAFNVAVGAPAFSTLTTSYEKTFETNENETSSVLFTNYIFTSVEPEALQEMHIVFSTTTDDKELDCKITANSVILKRNEVITAGGKLISGSTEIEPIEPELPEPKIGDYFFIDGTWGTSLTADNKDDCIGIVYEVKQQEGDYITDYGEEAVGKTILGYVVALKNMYGGRFEFYDSKNMPELFPKVEGDNFDTDKMKFNGYANTKKLLESNLYIANPTSYVTLNKFVTWKNESASILPKYASDWYIPSAYQLLKIMGYCCGFVNTISPANAVYTESIECNPALQTAFLKAMEMGIAEDFVGTETTQRPLQSSTIYGNSYNVVERYRAVPDKPFTGEISIKQNEKAGGYVRPVFTILK